MAKPEGTTCESRESTAMRSTFVHVTTEGEQRLRRFLIANVGSHHRRVVHRVNESSEIPDVHFAGIGPCRGDLAIVDRGGLKNRSEWNARTAELGPTRIRLTPP
jgi:hypothetical protein